MLYQVGDGSKIRWNINMSEVHALHCHFQEEYGSGSYL